MKILQLTEVDKDKYLARMFNKEFERRLAGEAVVGNDDVLNDAAENVEERHFRDQFQGYSNPYILC